MGRIIKILAIDTSCDETSASVTEESRILSNIVWSQASLHAKFGGVYPSLAQREHRQRIDWVIEKALRNAKAKITQVDAVAVTTGPGLAVALEVGIQKAKVISKKYNIPLIPVNHIEGHLLSCLALPKNSKDNLLISKLFPAYGLVVSGGNTQLIYAEKLGKYAILADTTDDALGEALDKGARLLGFGYPGASVLEKFAKEGKVNSYSLPIPLLGKEALHKFSYSGLKTALVRLVEKIKNQKGGLEKKDIKNLAASYQEVAFIHVIRVVGKIIYQNKYPAKSLIIGGGVSVNNTFRRKIRKIAKENSLTIRFPYSKKLCTDNAAMVGVSAYVNSKTNRILKPNQLENIDRKPRLKINEKMF
jgi:N6-L-threonylcarbamoyladenine synthase